MPTATAVNDSNRARNGTYRYARHPILQNAEHITAFWIL